MFHSAVGFDGSWGRFKGLIRPAEGNHDAADPGPGFPGFQEYFAGNLANLECSRLSPPSWPDLGYYDFDLPNGWYVLVLNSNCGRAPGATGMAAGDGRRSTVAFLATYHTRPDLPFRRSYLR